MSATLPTRSQADPARTWDVESVYANDTEWEAACARVRDALPALAAFQGRLGEGPAVLAEFLAASERAQREYSKIRIYATMRGAVDSNDEAGAGLSARASGIQGQLQASTAFLEPELLSIGLDTVRGWIAEHEPLRIYGHWVDRLARHAPHVRTAEVEEVIGLAAEPLASAAAVHGVLANAELRFRPAVDSDGGEHDVAQGTFDVLFSSPDRALRQSAWESYADAHRGLAKTMAAALATGARGDVFIARARRYRDSLDAALTPNDIPVQVFHNVIDAFRDHVGTWQRYWRLRRRVLGLERLREVDTRATLGPEVKVPFEQAVDWIGEGMAPLGDDYVTAMRRGVLEQRWVDVYPNQGKRQGAFSTGSPDTHPFVFMSYGGGLAAMSTLAHELGHSMHNYLSSRAQPFVYARYGLFLAEVASNFNQALVRSHLLASNPDPVFQVALLLEAMGNFHRYFLIMPTLSRFELELHQRVERGESVTAVQMTELMADLLAEVYGSEVEMDRERAGTLWAQFPTHLYMNFYAYQYATGIAAANVLAAGVYEGRPGAVERYRAFLASGGSRYPLDTLRDAGVDLRSREPIDHAFAILAGYVERLEALLL